MSILESSLLRLRKNIKHHIAHLLLYQWVFSISAKYLCGLNQYFSKWEHNTFCRGVLFLRRVWSIKKFLSLNKISDKIGGPLLFKCLHVTIWPLTYVCWVFSCLSWIYKSFYCKLFWTFSPPLSLFSGHCYWCTLC